MGDLKTGSPVRLVAKLPDFHPQDQADGGEAPEQGARGGAESHRRLHLQGAPHAEKQKKQSRRFAVDFFVPRQLEQMDSSFKEHIGDTQTHARRFLPFAIGHIVFVFFVFSQETYANGSFI